MLCCIVQFRVKLTSTLTALTASDLFGVVQNPSHQNGYGHFYCFPLYYFVRDCASETSVKVLGINTRARKAFRCLSRKAI